MKQAVVDTTVLFAAALEWHPNFDKSNQWLRDSDGTYELFVCTHTLAELYSNLTKTFVQPRISPSEASRIVKSQSRKIRQISLGIRDYRETIELCGRLGLESGIIYDALIARAAKKRGVLYLCTFNLRHFRRLWAADRLISP